MDEIEIGEFSDVESTDSSEYSTMEEIEHDAENSLSSEVDMECDLGEDDDNVRYTLPTGYTYDPSTGTLRKAATESEEEDVMSLTDSLSSIEEDEFVWRKFTTFPTSTYNVPTFTLKGRAGRLEDGSSPFAALKAFMHDEIITEMCQQTNKYAKEDNKKVNLEEVAEGEMWSFLALQVLSGIIKTPRIKMYFSTNPMVSTTYFNSVFPRNRYEDILRFFHLADNTKVDKTDRTSEFGVILDSMMTSFRNNAIPGGDLCLDELLVKYSGRLAFKQFIRTKRSRFGVKVFVISDSEENYALNTLMYTSKSTKLAYDKAKLGFAGSVVLTLVEPYNEAGRNLFIDNWFSSVKLLFELLKMGTHTCGTARRNRKNLPTFSSASNRLDKGGYEHFFSGSILCERWQDRREVVMLNTFCKPGLTDVRNRHGKVERKPQSVMSYNKYMGSTDFIDKQLKPYEIIRKTYKWYKKLFFWFFDLSIWNSYVVYKRLKRDNEKITFLDYKLKLVDNIVTRYGSNRKVMGRPVLRDIPDSIRKTGQHWPEPTPGKKKLACVLCMSKNQRHRTVLQCDKCKKPLCKFCFKEYHVN